MVADGELTLVDEMIAARVYDASFLHDGRDDCLHISRWEPLEEKAAPGQWDYFQRDAHTAGNP
jgi:hypothetical protein